MLPPEIYRPEKRERNSNKELFSTSESSPEQNESPKTTETEKRGEVIFSTKGDQLKRPQEEKRPSPELEPSFFTLDFRKVVERANLLVKPLRRRYLSGEVVATEVKGIDGGLLGISHFEVDSLLGSGFAAQVYRARGEDGQEYALKPLRPDNGLKESFRNMLFLLGFRVPFSPQSNEDAVQTGLMWQDLLRQATEARFGYEGKVAKPYGYYFDSSLGCFVEIHEFVNGRQVFLEPDDGIFTRRIIRTKNFFRRHFGKSQEQLPEHDREIDQKQRFMSELVSLSEEMGMDDLARQFRWYTLVSQTNVLRRNEVSPEDENSPGLVVVDCRPGLTVLPIIGMFMSPSDFIRGARELLRGKLEVHYDKTNLRKLETFNSNHPGQLDEEKLAKLTEIENRYRQSLDKTGRREAFIRFWLSQGLISREKSEELKEKGFSFGYLLARFIPGIRNEQYLSHLRRIISNKEYRAEYLQVLKANNIEHWLAEDEITPEQAEKLFQSTARFFKFKLLDYPAMKVGRKLNDVIVTPARLIFGIGKDFRVKWMQERIQEMLEAGQITKESALQLSEQAKEPSAQYFLRDTTALIALEAISKLITVPVGAYLSLETQSILPLVGLAAWQFQPIPVIIPSPSGLLRGGYMAVRTLAFDAFREGKTAIIRKGAKKGLKDFTGFILERGVITAGTILKTVGNGVLPAAMASRYPGLSAVLARHITREAAKFVPIVGDIYGAEGGLIETTMFDLVYSLPLSVRKLFPRKTRVDTESVTN